MLNQYQKSTTPPDMDFETYSAAGYVFDGEKFVGAMPNKRGIALAGAAAYAEHPSTEVLSLAYDLKDGIGPRLWVPGQAPPADLFAHIAAGGLIEAHNSFFEFCIWHYVCHQRMGWPELPLGQLRDSMAKAKAYNLPGKLEHAAAVLDLTEQKDTAGGRIMIKLSTPRKPTKKNKDLRWTPETAPEDFKRLYSYNVQDIRTEAALSAACPDLQPQETALWLLDQRINARGVHIDVKALNDCIAVFDYVSEKYTAELQAITGGAVETASQVAKMTGWLGAHGVHTASLDEEAVETLLARQDLPPQCRRVIEIRAALGSSSVKKLFSIKHRLNSDSRIRGIIQFCGADRTGRFSGRGPQPQNLPNSGPKIDGEPWNPEAVERAFSVFSQGPEHAYATYGADTIAVISGCLRGLFTAAPENELKCSDYSAIEGVVAAMLAGEQWRIDVFRDHGKIYEMGASKITGVPFEEMMRYKEETGEHHPTRKTIGKVSELASGFGGWINAWLRFGAGEFMTEPEIKQAILAWRAASPSIVEMWGGQHRKHPDRWEFTPELYGLEGAAVSALLAPGNFYSYRGITYYYHAADQVLYCQLLSGRFIHYHSARLQPHTAKNGQAEYQIIYEGCSNSKGGGWVTNYTYGGKLFENVVQATARDILTNAMLNLDAAGYPIVLHVHDEVVVETPPDFGSIEELERIMGIMPGWASDWPIRAAGGWRGHRYRKD